MPHPLYVLAGLLLTIGVQAQKIELQNLSDCEVGIFVNQIPYGSCKIQGTGKLYQLKAGESQYIDPPPPAYWIPAFGIDDGEAEPQIIGEAKCGFESIHIGYNNHLSLEYLGSVVRIRNLKGKME